MREIFSGKQNLYHLQCREQAGPKPPRVPEQRKPELCILTRCQQDVVSTGGRRSGCLPGLLGPAYSVVRDAG